ncbi:hypothetical protein D3C81_2155000 [compost metagenome]
MLYLELLLPVDRFAPLFFTDNMHAFILLQEQEGKRNIQRTCNIIQSGDGGGSFVVLYLAHKALG